LGDHFKIFNAGLCIEDFKVASFVIIAVLQLIKVDLSLLFFRLHKTSVARLNFL
jgi:hypothetical protein